ncbi:MAG: phosphate acyltransferase PlsX [Bacteroidetes bacterium]|nr:phosphate acyltransferase PlsX [Bacteroidota bacterium]
MGGDYAPANAVLGAVEAAKENSDIDLILVGKVDAILNVLNENNISFDKDKIVNADEVIGMSDSPTAALKSKPNSSIVLGAKLVKDKKADAFVSAGNTGAMMAASTLLIGRLKGCSRPTIGATFPTANDKFCLVYDVGASVDCKPSHLFEYALMGSLFVKEIFGVNNPTVGLLSVGEEDSKGNELTFATFKLLKESNLNFIGNVEGRDILKGTTDIVVCDGFVGNIILKFAESFMSTLKVTLKAYAEKGIMNKLRALVTKITLKEALKKFDYQTYGGVPLLGVNGISIIGHGSSSALAIKNMVLRAKEMHDKNIIKKFEESLKTYAENK